MRRKICAVVCAMAIAVAIWGCGRGADTRENSGMTEADAQGSGVESAEGQESDSMAGVDALTDAAGLAGTSFSILGDSISTFQGYNPVGYSVYFPEYGEVAHVEDTWWQRVADDPLCERFQRWSNRGGRFHRNGQSPMRLQ